LLDMSGPGIPAAAPVSVMCNVEWQRCADI
jgi:hypothetical protein